MLPRGCYTVFHVFNDNSYQHSSSDVNIRVHFKKVLSEEKNNLDSKLEYLQRKNK